eukprot:scaffold390_cov115-Isochrysis_galbana.AAC.6
MPAQARGAPGTAALAAAKRDGCSVLIQKELVGHATFPAPNPPSPVPHTHSYLHGISSSLKRNCQKGMGGGGAGQQQNLTGPSTTKLLILILPAALDQDCAAPGAAPPAAPRHTARTALAAPAA